MTVRKNFNFDEEVANHLEEIAKKEGKTQTQIVTEALEKYYKERRKQERLEALEAIRGSFDGMIGDIDIKKAKMEYLAEKYGV